MKRVKKTATFCHLTPNANNNETLNAHTVGRWINKHFVRCGGGGPSTAAPLELRAQDSYISMHISGDKLFEQAPRLRLYIRRSAVDKEKRTDFLWMLSIFPSVAIERSIRRSRMISQKITRSIFKLELRPKGKYNTSAAHSYIY